jgi:hypothetical protein
MELIQMNTSFNSYSHAQYSPYAEAASQTAPVETNFPPVGKPATYRAKEIAKNYDISHTANRVSDLENVFQVMNGRLDTLGNQLKNFGRDSIKFKANHMENLMIDPNHSLAEIYEVTKNQEKEAEMKIKEALLTELKAKEAVKKAEAEDKYVNIEFEKLIRAQQKKNQPQAQEFKSHKSYHHSYPKDSESQVSINFDLAKVAAAVAYISANTFSGGIVGAFIAFNLFRSMGL